MAAQVLGDHLRSMESIDASDYLITRQHWRLPNGSLRVAEIELHAANGSTGGFIQAQHCAPLRPDLRLVLLGSEYVQVYPEEGT